MVNIMSKYYLALQFVLKSHQFRSKQTEFYSFPLSTVLRCLKIIFILVDVWNGYMRPKLLTCVF